MKTPFFTLVTKEYRITTLENFHFHDAHILRPSFDTAFKAIFSQQPENLINLLNSAFAFNPPIRSITFLNTELPPDKDGAKTCRLDVAAKLDNGSIIDIEIQMNPDPNMLSRSIVYTAKLLSSQVEKGSKKPPPKVITLVLLNYTIRKEAPRKWHHTFEPRDEEGNLLEPGAFRIDFIELPKAKQLQTYRNSLFSHWVEFFTADTFTELETVCAKNTQLNQALETLKMISKKQQIWSEARGMLEAGATREFVRKALKITDAELTALLATDFAEPTDPNNTPDTAQ